MTWRAGPLLPLLAGCALDVVFPEGPAPGDTSGPVRTAATPVAPTADAPMWQGRQEAFLDAEGAPCATTVAAAMSEAAFCFVAAGDELRCAGRVHTEVFGADFAPTGVTSAREVHLSATIDGENAACALAGGVLECLGGENTSGQLANGTTGPNDVFLPWGSVAQVSGAATGTWDQLCVLDEAGEAWCAGHGYGETPVAMGTHGAVLIDTAGTPSFDDPSRWRASAGRSVCFVTAEGLSCEEGLGEFGLLGSLGTPGHVVDGGMRGTFPPSACWLDDEGQARCGERTSDAEPVFTDQPVLLLAVNYYTDALCAIYADGAIACRGSNDNGKLGVGDVEALAADTLVAPAGTVDTRCR